MRGCPFRFRPSVAGASLPAKALKKYGIVASAGHTDATYDDMMRAMENGIAKINVATEIRQPYEFALEEKPGSITYAQEKVYDRTRWVLREFLHTTDNHDKLGG